MQAVIPVGVAYNQLIEDVRAVVRHELHHHNPTATGAAPADELLSIVETAALLGITKQTVHEWKRRGMLKYHKLGSRTYFKKSEVLAALCEYRRSAKTGKGGTRA